MRALAHPQKRGLRPASPRLVVEVRGGRSGGTKVVIDPGRTMRFGRTEIADVAVPGDELLSGVHFELSWDGARCRLRDRNSHVGTTLGGAPVLRAEVPHGGWIRAGRTDFMVYVEGRTAPGDSMDEEAESDGAAGESEDEAARRAAAERAVIELRDEAARAPLYAVLDAARDEHILDIVRESVERHQSLYEGVDGEALEQVAPHLVGPMRADSMLLERLVLEGWGRRWGIFVTSDAPFKEVRRHLRRFLMVELTGNEEKVYFRFYDPSVMTAFLSTARPAQRRELSAGLHAALAERAPARAGLSRWELRDAHQR